MKQFSIKLLRSLSLSNYLSNTRLNGEDIEQILTSLASNYQPAPPPISIPRMTSECGPPLRCTVFFVVRCEEFYYQLSSESGQVREPDEQAVCILC